MKKAPLYFISGLGADERMFRNLTLDHPNPRHIKWIAPGKNEGLSSYAQRLLAQIEPSEEPPVLVGLSFGGIVAQEVAKLIPVKKLVLLSSLPCHQDLPGYYRLAGKLQLHQYTPFHFLRQWASPANWVFGAETAEDKILLRQVILDTDISYLRWALQQILAWKQPQASPLQLIIHGTRDKVLPVTPRPETKLIEGGQHLMVLNRAREVSALLNQVL